MKMKFEVELDVPQAFIDRRTPALDLFLVDDKGEKIAEPTEAEISAAEVKREENTQRNILQMLFQVPIANQLRHDGIEPGPDFKVTAKKL